MTAVMRRADAVRPARWEQSVFVAVCAKRTRRAWRVESCERTSVNHDEQFHQAIVDVAGRGGLDDEDVLISNGLAHCDAGFLVGVVQAHGLCNLYAQPVMCASSSATRGSQHLDPSRGLDNSLGL